MALDQCDGTVEQDVARAEIAKLRAAVESERALRRKAESRSRALARELEEEKELRAASERLCQELEEAAQRERGKARKAKKERRMMQAAWQIKEEGLLMKLTDARLEMEALRPEREGVGDAGDTSNLFG